MRMCVVGRSHGLCRVRLAELQVGEAPPLVLEEEPDAGESENAERREGNDDPEWRLGFLD